MKVFIFLLLLTSCKHIKVSCVNEKGELIYKDTVYLAGFLPSKHHKACTIENLEDFK